MSPLVENLWSVVVFPGLPLLAALGGAYFAIRHRARRPYALANVAVILVLAILVALQPTDSNAPNSALLMLAFLVFYVPLHLGVVGAICLISLYFERRQARQGT